jgi:hypothetical protein
MVKIKNYYHSLFELIDGGRNWQVSSTTGSGPISRISSPPFPLTIEVQQL